MSPGPLKVSSFLRVICVLNSSVLVLLHSHDSQSNITEPILTAVPSSLFTAARVAVQFCSLEVKVATPAASQVALQAVGSPRVVPGRQPRLLVLFILARFLAVTLGGWKPPPRLRVDSVAHRDHRVLGERG